MTPAATGNRMACGACGAEVVVVKAIAREAGCCGEGLRPLSGTGSRPGPAGAAPGPSSGTGTGTGTGTAIGKRYACAVCGGEVLCTRAGQGSLACCGAPMTIRQAKPLPASD